MTTIFVTPPDVAWLDPMATLLREQGMKVVRLGTLSIIGFLLMSDKIAAVVVHEDCVSDDWDTVRERMQRIAPTSKIIVVQRNDQRSPSTLAALVSGV
jgi:hypothetical protein